MSTEKSTLREQIAAAIDPEIRDAIDSIFSEQRYAELKQMLLHHLGYSMNNQNTGKRIRPTLTLLMAAACGDDWRAALPYAAQIELIHNFSLIHDDIEDNSDLRRGQPTVWKVWGMPHAINAGDLMFSMAHLTGVRAASTLGAERQLRIQQEVMRTCVDLTLGQFLDMDFETRLNVTTDEYLRMISGKTAAMLACSLTVGALAGLASEEIVADARVLGEKIGLAFQIQDDWLGVWGDPAVTGKSAASDIVSGKKTYPILLGIEASDSFRNLYNQPEKLQQNAGKLAELLMEIGVSEETGRMIDQLTDEALGILDRMELRAEPKQELSAIIRKLCRRDY